MAFPFAYEVLAGESSADFSQPIPEHASGDRLVAVLTQDVGSTAIAVAGWTEIGTQSAAQEQRTAVFQKLAASSAEADLVATGTNARWIGAIIVIRGAHATTPFPQNNRTNSANSTTAFLDSGTVTTTEANVMLLYIWGFDAEYKLIPENPSHIVGLTKQINFCCQIVGYRNQPVAGTSQVVRALHERANEGGTALVIAVADAAPSTPQMAPFFTETYEIVHRYGGGVSPIDGNSTFGRHDSSSTSFENAEGLGATTIDGVDLLDLTTAYATAGIVSWGTPSQFNVSGSAIDSTGRWVGGAVPVSPTANMTNKLFSVEFGISNVGDTFGTKGVIIVFESSSSDWVAFTLSVKRGMVVNTLHRTFIDVSSATPLASGGTINWGAINKIGYLYHRVGTTTTGLAVRFRQAILLSKSVVVDGCAALPVNGPSLVNLGFWGIDNLVNLVNLQGTGQVKIPYGLDIGDGTRPTFSKFLGGSTEFPVAFGTSFQRRLWNVGANSPGAQIVINAGPDDVVGLANSIFAAETSQELIIDAGSDPTADYSFSGTVLVGFKITNNVAGVVLSSVTSVGGQTLTLNGGGLEDFTISAPTQSPALITNDPGNIADCSFTSAGTGHAIEITAPITADFFGNTFTGYGADGTTDAALYNNSGGLVTLVLEAGDATPTVRNGTGASTVFDAPVVAFSAPNLAEDAIYQVLHRQTFTVAATAINTTTNALTLTTDTNGDAPDFDTSTANRHTICRVILSAGATIPTSTPQIQNTGSYRVASLSSGAITLEVTEGGGAINFTTQGINGGGGTVFTLVFETLVTEGTVVGSSGISESVTLPDGAIYRFKAIHQDATGGPRLSTRVTDVIGAWSDVGGASFVGTVNALSPASDLWTEANRIAGLSNYELEDTVIDNAGNVITSVNPVEDGADIGGLSFVLEGHGFIQINAGAITKNSVSVNGALSGQDLVMWAVYQLGILDNLYLASFTTVVLDGLSNAVIDNVEFDETSGNLFQIYGMNIRERDGRPIVASTTTGAIVPNVATRGNVGLTSVGSGLSTEQNTALEAIKTKTDQLAFTVANQVDANALTGGGSGLDAAGVRAAVGLAAANLDTQLSAIDTVVDAILVDTGTTIPAQITARSLEAAAYFDPAADTVANVTTVGTVTNPVEASNMRGTDGAITSLAGIATTTNVTDAQTAIITAGGAWETADVSGLLTTTAYNSSIPANFSDLAIAETSGTVTAGNMRGTDGAITGLSGIATATNVSDAQSAIITAGANWVTATGFITPANLPPNFGALAITVGGLVTTTNPGSGATAAQVWEYSGGDRALSGPQATAITSAATLAQVNAAGFTTDRNNALTAMAKQLGLVAGVTATHDPDGITVSDGDGSTVITDNLDGSYTVSKAP